MQPNMQLSNQNCSSIEAAVEHKQAAAVDNNLAEVAPGNIPEVVDNSPAVLLAVGNIPAVENYLQIYPFGLGLDPDSEPDNLIGLVAVDWMYFHHCNNQKQHLSFLEEGQLDAVLMK